MHCFPSLCVGSFPAIYIGAVAMKNSLRLVDFEIRAEVVKEAIARVRESAKSRPAISRKVRLQIVHVEQRVDSR